MSATRETCIKDYLKDKQAGNHARLNETISFHQFEDLSWFLHISDPSLQGTAYTKV